MIKLELKRLHREFDYHPKQIICTMKQTVDFCALAWNGNRFKYPKLSELYKKLFWQYFIWAHDAIVDVEATLQSFMELYKQKIIHVNEKKHHTMSLF
jgi:DNA polymerase-3 subunit alpha